MLPINSAINPVIYTLAAPTGLSKRAYRSLCRFFQRLANFAAALLGLTRQKNSSGCSGQRQRLDSGTVLGASNSNGETNQSTYSKISDQTHNTNTRSSNGSVISIAMKALKGGPPVNCGSHQSTLSLSGANCNAVEARRSSVPQSVLFSTMLDSDGLSSVTASILDATAAVKSQQIVTKV